MASVGDSVYEFGFAETLMMTHEALGLVDEVIIHTFIDRKKRRVRLKRYHFGLCVRNS